MGYLTLCDIIAKIADEGRRREGPRNREQRGRFRVESVVLSARPRAALSAKRALTSPRYRGGNSKRPGRGASFFFGGAAGTLLLPARRHRSFLLLPVCSRMLRECEWE